MKQFSKLLAQRQIKTLLIASGHKRVHGIKFQSSPIPNGLIGILSCPYVGKRHDSVMFMSQGCSQIYRDQYDIINPICGDQTYPLSIHLQAPFFRQNLTPNPVNYNGCSNEIKTYFKFVSVKSRMKIGLSAVGKIYCGWPLLQNARTCFMRIIKFLSFYCSFAQDQMLYFLYLKFKRKKVLCTNQPIALPNLGSGKLKKKQ